MQDVTAAVIIQNEKVLITRRAADQKHAGWPIAEKLADAPRSEPEKVLR